MRKRGRTRCVRRRRHGQEGSHQVGELARGHAVGFRQDFFGRLIAKYAQRVLEVALRVHVAGLAAGKRAECKVAQGEIRLQEYRSLQRLARSLIVAELLCDRRVQIVSGGIELVRANEAFAQRSRFGEPAFVCCRSGVLGQRFGSIWRIRDLGIVRGNEWRFNGRRRRASAFAQRTKLNGIAGRRCLARSLCAATWPRL